MGRNAQTFETSQAGSPTLEALYRHNASWLSARLRRVYGPQNVEDIVQETYIRLAPYQGLREIRHARALLWTIARNLARNHHKRVGRGGVAASLDERPADAPIEAASQYESALLQDIVLALAEPLREVFVLGRLAGMTNDEIAGRLGVSVATVERRMAKAVALCARRLRD